MLPFNAISCLLEFLISLASSKHPNGISQSSFYSFSYFIVYAVRILMNGLTAQR
jgi:hypothetical protein